MVWRAKVVRVAFLVLTAMGGAEEELLEKLASEMSLGASPEEQWRLQRIKENRMKMGKLNLMMKKNIFFVIQIFLDYLAFFNPAILYFTY